MLKKILSNFVSKIELEGVAVHILPASTALESSVIESDLPQEERQLAMAINAPARKIEFLRSRWLAHQLIGTSEPIVRSVHGDPIWPSGWKGSISHKNGHVAVAVMKRDYGFSIGLDLECIDRVGKHLAAKICQDKELPLLEENGVETPDKAPLAVLFSVKEALFKSHFPIGQKFFYFHDAGVESIHWGPTGSGIACGRVFLETSPITPPGSPFIASFHKLDLDGSKHVLAMVKTPLGNLR